MTYRWVASLAVIAIANAQCANVYIVLDSTYSTDVDTCAKNASDPLWMDRCTATGAAPYGAPNFYATLDDAKHLAMDLNSMGLNVGLVQYGSAVYAEWALDKYTGNSSGMTRHFSAVKWHADFQTDLYPAISSVSAALESFSAAKDTRKTIVIVTDGKYQDEVEAVNAAILARATGAEIWIFAWGKGVFESADAMEHFTKLTGAPERVLIVENPEGVKEALSFDLICKGVAEPPAGPTSISRNIYHMWPNRMVGDVKCRSRMHQWTGLALYTGMKGRVS
jgi:hypothetical protein